MAWLLLAAGAAISLYSLWQLRSWLSRVEERTSARKIEGLVDELVATAETTAAVVAEKAQTLEEKIAEADRRAARLEALMQSQSGLAGAAPAAPAPPVAAIPPVASSDSGVPEAHRRVYAMADAGMDVTAIARQLNVTKGEVQLILGLRTSA